MNKPILLFRTAAALLLALLFSGCAATVKHELNFNPAEPLRVAVLPFVQLNERGEFAEPSPGLFLDAVPLVSAKLEDTPAELIRQLTYSELAATSLDVLAPFLVNVELPHYGFGKPDGSFDLQRLYSAAPAELCTKFLDCDALLYGRVTQWKRAYYGVESVNSVGVELKLVSARSGSVLYRASGSDSENRGLSGGPTGFVDIVLEPIKGLGSDVITAVARRLVKELVKPLRVDQRPQFLAEPPPSIFASSHDQLSGYFSRKSFLTVLIYGTEKATAAFSVGNAVKNIPMIEVKPGHYFGEYHPLPDDSFENQPVVVTLTDAAGRSSSQEVTAPPLNLRS